MNAGDQKTDTGDKLGSLTGLSLIALMGDARGSNLLGRTNITARHNGLCNILFADNHVSPITLTPRILGTDGSNNYYDHLWGVEKYKSKWESNP